MTSLRLAALHRGQVRYGNVGAPDRLDFTIIGADVSKTARLEEIAARHERSWCSLPSWLVLFRDL